MITRAVQAANSVGIFIFWLEFVACEGEDASFNRLMNSASAAKARTSLP
jgi:hypothetical protein